MRTQTHAQQLATAQATYWAIRDRKKPRRKLAWHEHKGVAHYDRERMRQSLLPIVHPRDFDGWSTPLPSWIDADWVAPDQSDTQSIDNPKIGDLSGPSITETSDYRMQRCHVETVCQRRERRHGEWLTNRRPVLYRWELTFADGATFRFAGRAIAETALSELLKIRKAKHPRQKFGKHSPENESVFFTNRKLQKLPADPSSVELTAEAIPVETAA